MLNGATGVARSPNMGRMVLYFEFGHGYSSSLKGRFLLDNSLTMSRTGAILQEYTQANVLAF